MTVWFTSLTIFNRRFSLRSAVILAICVAFTTTLLFGIISQISHAAPGVNQNLSFQGRLLDASGNVVPDGNYNVQFKIYQDGTGTAANNPGGTLKWTETYINNGAATGVNVKNGYLSVNLGELNPFGTSVDWNQDTLWLSMNVAGSSASCTTFGTSPCVADGEMLPMKRMTASPYSLNSAKLGGIDSTGYIHNTTTAQTADITINGSAKANTLQGSASVSAPLIDAINVDDTLNIGTVSALAINIGRATSANTTINIGTGLGNRTLVMGSTAGTSSTTIQGASGGVRVNTSDTGGFVVHDSGNNYNPLVIANGGASFNIGTGSTFRVINDASGQSVFDVLGNGSILTADTSTFEARGNATFDKGITVQGGGSLTYTTPNGYNMSTAINIPNYTVGAYNSVLAFGLPSTSAATARGMLVSDGRTVSHQATIGVLSPDENAILGLSWNGSNTTGTLANTANSLALQGNGLNLLTATNNGGSANVGIGNSAAAGYALDVTGDVNTSTQYRINGVTALTGAALTFGDASASSVNSATSQSLSLNGSTGVNINSNGATSASFSNTQIKIGTGSGAGAPVLLTVDKAATAPTVSGDAMLGSMYYDTTLGEVQCYEAAGWGNCSASPDNFITISPQYSNAVMHGTGTGTMTSDLCSDALNINDGSSAQPTICGTNETYNFYDWTSSQVTTQNRSIYVTYQLPSSFKGFVAGSTSLMGRTDSTDGTVAYQVYRNTSTGLTACGSSVPVSTGVQTTWQKGTATSTADPSTCSFVAGDSIVFKISLDSLNNANAYASTLGFAFTNK